MDAEAPAEATAQVPTWTLTSIQKHQGSEHQERSCLPNELIQHTPKGGAHCTAETEGPVPGPRTKWPLPTGGAQVFLTFLYFVGIAILCSSAKSPWHLQAILHPETWLRVPTGHPRSKNQREIGPRPQNCTWSAGKRVSEDFIPNQLAQTAGEGSQTKARAGTQKGEHRSLLSARYLPPGREVSRAVGGQPARGKVPGCYGSSENV